MKYFLYARKSEEDHKRQIESIPRQIKQLKERFPDCEIVDVFTEETTAKKPGRKQFDAMITRVKAGEAQGILVWALNRLLRNPVDHGTIAWLLQTNVLKSVQTMEKEYTPKDNVLILSVDAGVSTQFIKDLVEHTVAALNEKVEAGWFPHRAPAGYLNDTSKPKGQRDIIPDPVRWTIVRQAWEMMLTGSYTVMDVLQFFHRSGYRGRPHLNSTTGCMSKTALYRIFDNRFYCGEFWRNGTWHRGKHIPMVTAAEFNRVQTLLGRETKTKKEKHSFAYSGLIRCGKCGCQMCGERRYRKLRDNGVNLHMYYACSNSRKVCNKKGITEADLEAQFSDQLQAISIHPDYRDLLLRIWEHYFQSSILQEANTAQSQELLLDQKRAERKRLLDLRLRDLIDDDLFRDKKSELDAEVSTLEAEIGVNQGNVDKKYEETKNVLLFATEPKDRFSSLPIEDRRSVASYLGTTYTLTDGKLALELNKLLLPIAKNAKVFEAECAIFERTVFRSESKQKAAFNRFSLVWGAKWNEIRTEAVASNALFPRISVDNPILLGGPDVSVGSCKPTC